METCKTCRFYQADWGYPDEAGPYHGSYPGYKDANKGDRAVAVGRCRKSSPASMDEFPKRDEAAWCGDWEQILNATNKPCPPPPPSGKDLPT